MTNVKFVTFSTGDKARAADKRYARYKLSAGLAGSGRERLRQRTCARQQRYSRPIGGHNGVGSPPPSPPGDGQRGRRGQ